MPCSVVLSIHFCSNCMLFISGSEILVILFAAYLLFGGKKIPEIAKGLAKGIRELRKITDDIKTEINKGDIGSGIKEEIKELKESTGSISKELNDNTSEIVREITKTKEI